MGEQFIFYVFCCGLVVIDFTRILQDYFSGNEATIQKCWLKNHEKDGLHSSTEKRVRDKKNVAYIFHEYTTRGTR